MAARRSIRSKAGTKRTFGGVQVPANQQDIAAAVEQLQDSLNEVIVRFNAHQHAALNAVPSTTLVTGAGAADASLFTAAPSST